MIGDYVFFDVKCVRLCTKVSNLCDLCATDDNLDMMWIVDKFEWFCEVKTMFVFYKLIYTLNFIKPIMIVKMKKAFRWWS